MKRLCYCPTPAGKYQSLVVQMICRILELTTPSSNLPIQAKLGWALESITLALSNRADVRECTIQLALMGTVGDEFCWLLEQFCGNYAYVFISLVTAGKHQPNSTG